MRTMPPCAPPTRPSVSSAGSRAASGKWGHDAERRPGRGGLDRPQAFVEEMNISAHLVDNEAMNARAIIARQHDARADETRDHAAAVDVADEDHRHARRLGEAHIGDVAGAQVDLGRAARALDQDDVGASPDDREALHDRRQQFALARRIVARPHRRETATLHDHLRAGLALRLQQHGVHVHARRDAGGTRLQRLRAADLAAIRRDRGVVRHVLRLERHDAHAAPDQEARQTGDQRRLADVGAGALEHQRRRQGSALPTRPCAAQNSMPFCAFTPERKGCLTSSISVTRSAISISASGALRPVTMT